jgi:hypothetical protein
MRSLLPPFETRPYPAHNGNKGVGSQPSESDGRKGNLHSDFDIAEGARLNFLFGGRG